MDHECSIEEYRTLWNSLGVSVIIVDREEGIILFVNGEVCEVLEKTPEEIEGRHYTTIFWPEFRRFYEQLAEDCADGEKHTRQYYWTEKVIWEQITASLVTWHGRKAVLLAITNVTDIAQMEYEYKQIAFFDGTTELPNERKLEEDISEMADVERTALVYFELKHLGGIYDHYGWSVGDALLTSIKDWLFQNSRARTLLYRVNAGFALFEREATREDLVRRAEVLIERFSSPWILPVAGQELPVFSTIKIAIVFGRYVKNEMRNILLRTLDLAEESTKGYVIYDESTDEELKKLHKLRAELINSIHNGMAGFEVHFHPIVKAGTHEWASLEALCRWTSPSEGKVSPYVFIAEAEHLGLISRLDDWVLAKAMDTYCQMGLEKRGLFLNVNVSPYRPFDSQYVDAVKSLADKLGFPLERLSLEITESERVRFSEETLLDFDEMIREGIILALDDFGSGFSSIENLIKISASLLKTDKLLIEDFEKDEGRQYLMKTLIDLAHSLGMKIIVEGVETEVQKTLLENMGADFMQGYLFSVPLSADDMAEVLTRP